MENNTLIYKNIPAISELNKVVGFNPLNFLRKVKINGNELMHLDLKYKKLWFRLKHPNGRIDISPLRITEQIAIIEAKVFFDKNDAKPVSSFIAERYAKTTKGGLYIETAQHVAMDSALTSAGFGIQFSDVNSVDSEVYSTNEATSVRTSQPSNVNTSQVQNNACNLSADTTTAQTVSANATEVTPENASNVVNDVKEPVKTANETLQNTAIATETTTQVENINVANNGNTNTEVSTTTVIEQPISQVQSTVSTEVSTSTNQAPASTFVSNETEQTQSGTISADTNLDPQTMTLEEARNVIVDIGSCSGWTLAQVEERRFASIVWYANGYNGDNDLIKVAAKIIIENKEKNAQSA